MWDIECILFCLRSCGISDVFCFLYIYVGYRVYFVLFTFHVGYRCILFCLRLCRISMYFVLFTFMWDIECILFCLHSMWDIDVFCFVYVCGISVYFLYIYVGYRCILFCLRLCRISMYFVLFTFM